VSAYSSEIAYAEGDINMALSQERRIVRTDTAASTFKSVKQNIVMENRERLKISGVNDVECFNEDSITALTELGRLLIKGTNLKVSSLNLENSELCVEGYINQLEYAEKKKRKSSRFGKN